MTLINKHRLNWAKRPYSVFGLSGGCIVLVWFIAPIRREREMAPELVEEEEYLEVFIDTPLGAL